MKYPIPKWAKLSANGLDLELGEIDEFFVESSEHSRVKATIAAKYFVAWAKVIIPTARRFGNRIAYADLFAGPGRYIDGTKSTPLLILEQAIANPTLRGMLVTVFNDANSAHAESLEKAVRALAGVQTLRHQPKIITSKVGSETVAEFQKPLVPTFAFIDPFGYVGLSLGLVNAVIKDWACECLFFFNYNRINPGISNPRVAHRMAALFGVERLDALKAAVEGRSPGERESLIMVALAEALREMGGRYVLPFRFRTEDGRTSHHLVFASKEFLGYRIMREVMAKESSSSAQGVPSFEYNVRDLVAPPLFDLSRPLDDLIVALTADLAGQTLTVGEVFERHSQGRLYVIRNYREALLQLEEQKRVAMNPPASTRRPYKGKPSLPDDVLVTFPPGPARGVKMGGGRSTPVHQAYDPQPSGFARPTA